MENSDEEGRIPWMRGGGVTQVEDSGGLEVDGGSGNSLNQ